MQLSFVITNKGKQTMVALTVEERKRRLKRGDMATIARRLGVSDAAVHSVVEGKSRSRRIEKALARRMNTPVDEAFPREAKPLLNDQAA